MRGFFQPSCLIRTLRVRERSRNSWRGRESRFAWRRALRTHCGSSDRRIFVCCSSWLTWQMNRVFVFLMRCVEQRLPRQWLREAAFPWSYRALPLEEIGRFEARTATATDWMKNRSGSECLPCAQLASVKWSCRSRSFANYRAQATSSARISDDKISALPMNELVRQIVR